MRATPLTALALLLAACNGGRGDDTSVEHVDLDGDGYTDDVDCDDEDENVFPGAPEVCNGVDDDCDGTVDVDAIDAGTWYYDGDDDGYGVEGDTVEACEAPTGYAENAGDCNDDDSAYNPGADESDCTDPNDYNCDGSVGYDDADEDGFAACEDCNDADEAVNPDATEICNGIDDNCDDVTDTDAVDLATWYLDEDGDGFGSDVTAQACDQPEGYVAVSGDCLDDPADELATAVNPDADEQCDDVDRNCDGDPIADAVDKQTFYLDFDGDGFGTDETTEQACAPSEGYVARAGDCTDDDDLVNPDATEVCDDVDNNCSGTVDDVNDWWDDSWAYRIPVSVTAPATGIDGPPVSIDVDFRAALDAQGDESAFRPDTLRVILEDCDLGRPEVPSQFDDGLVGLFDKASSVDPEGDGHGAVTFLYDTDGDTSSLEPLAAGETARFALYFASEATAGDLPAATYTTDLHVAADQLTNSRATVIFDAAKGGMIASMTTPTAQGSLLNQADACCGNGIINGPDRTTGVDWADDAQDGPATVEVLASGPVLGMLRSSGSRGDADDWGSYDFDYKWFRFAGRPETYGKVSMITTSPTTVGHPRDAVDSVRPFQALSRVMENDPDFADKDEAGTYINAFDGADGLLWSWVQPPEYRQYHGRSAGKYFLSIGNDYIESVPAEGNEVAVMTIPDDTPVLQDVVMMLLPHHSGFDELEPVMQGLMSGVAVETAAAESRPASE